MNADERGRRNPKDEGVGDLWCRGESNIWHLVASRRGHWTYTACGSLAPSFWPFSTLTVRTKRKIARRCRHCLAALNNGTVRRITQTADC
jgi:hypothetical protein